MSTNLELQHGSVEYVLVGPITFEVAGVATDPTGDTVQVAFRVVGDTSTQNWQAATWETNTVTGKYYARVLVGTAPLDLAVGFYAAFAKITDSPEAPIIPTDNLLAVTA